VWCAALAAGNLLGVMSAPALAINIPVRDSSFEELTKGVSTTPYSPREWAIFSGDNLGAAGRTVLIPPLPGQQGPDVGFIEVDNDSGFSVAFIDTAIIQEGTYTATLGLAHMPGREPTTAPFKINFEAVGFGHFELVGANTLPVGTVNSAGFTDVSGQTVISSGQAAIGKIMRLVLVADNQDVPTGARYLMDNVRLQFTPAGGGDPQDIFLGESSFQPVAWHRIWDDNYTAGIHRPPGPIFSNQQGDQLGFATVKDTGGISAVFQDHTIIRPGTYTMKALVGADPTAVPVDSHLVMKMEAALPGNDLIGDPAFIMSDMINTTTLTEFSNTVTIGLDSPFIGRTLRSVLVAEGAEQVQGTYFFDNVSIEYTPDPGFKTADFNNDGFVDGADLTSWGNAFGQDHTADANFDALSDGQDFLEWQRQYTGSAPGVPTAAAVPEPTAALLLGLSGFALPACGRRRTAK
jgi:hypothetical protein